MRRRTAAAACVGIAWACTGPGAPAEGDGDPGAGDAAGGGPDTGEQLVIPDGGAMDSVVWSLRWQTERLHPPQRGGAFSVQRPDGATFEVHEAWMVLTTLVVDPCSNFAQRARAAPPHGIPDHPSGIAAPLALAVHDVRDQELGRATFPQEEVCAFWMVSFQADDALANPPDERDLTGLSFWLDAEVQAEPGGAWVPHQVASSLQVEGDVFARELPDGAEHIEITLRPGGMFDETTLPVDDPPLAGWESLSALVRGATARAVSPTSPGDTGGAPDGPGGPR